jgi:ferredoxin-NADP reductase
VLTLEIRDVIPATPRSRIVRIDLAGRRFPYLPGQAVLIAAHGVERRRPYSIAAAPEDADREGWLELLVGVDESGAAGPHLTLERGALVDLEGPVGRFTFPIDPEETRFVFIAGGTGIAPLRAMLRHAMTEPTRQFGLLYSARRPSEFAFEHELQSFARAGRLELRQTVTREAADDWTGARGRIRTADLAPLIHHPETVCFICGPRSLVEEMPKLVGELGISAGRIRIEEWG